MLTLSQTNLIPTLIISNYKLAPLASFLQVFVSLSVPHLSAGEEKERSPPSGSVVAFSYSGAGYKTADLLTYFTLKAVASMRGGMSESPRMPFS